MIQFSLNITNVDVFISDTNFKQQKLPAWQPIMTAGTVLPLLFAIGIAFIPLGVGLLLTSNNVSELQFLEIYRRTLQVCNLMIRQPFIAGIWFYHPCTW